MGRVPSENKLTQGTSELRFWYPFQDGRRYDGMAMSMNRMESVAQEVTSS